MKTLLLFALASSLYANFFDLSNPRNTMKTFIKNMKDYKNGENSKIEQAKQALNLSEIPEDIRSELGINKSRSLINTIDRIRFVNYDLIPTDPNTDEWTFSKLENGNAEITIKKQDNGQWLFSKRTIETIQVYEDIVKNNEVARGVTALNDWKSQLKAKMPAWTANEVLLLKNGQWLGFLTLLLIAYLFARIARLYIGSIILGVFKKRGIKLNEKEELSFLIPFGLSVLFITLFLTTALLELDIETHKLLSRAFLILLTIFSVFASVKMVNIVSIYFEGLAKKTETKFDDVLIPLLSTAAKILVWAIGLILIGHSLTVDVKNIIAGLGIGGLAFALAAKDTLSNLFGSLTVILDRPFEIGDWVKFGNGVEGTVETVGFRSTRVRTFYGSEVTVPNNQLTNIHIDNMGRREFRRFSTKISLEYSTPVEKIEAFCEGIRNLIIKHPKTRKDYFHVYLCEMADSSLNVMLYLFWKVPDWSMELNEKHRLLVDIIRLAKDLEVEFAFPTQTHHVFQESAKNIQEIEDDFHHIGADRAKKIAEKPITPGLPRSSENDIQS